jgi:hypothetical protein
MLNVNTDQAFEESWDWLSKIHNKDLVMNIEWLGKGITSELIIKHLKNYLL